MSDELTAKVLKTLRGTGYPLELEVAAVARRRGWAVLHAREYPDPDTGKLRELDLVLFKIIQERRVEVRISCKSSSNKQFVFFNHDRTRYRPMGELKCTPLVGDPHWQSSVRDALATLPLFSYPLGAINYTVLSGDKADREGRALLRDAIMSAVSSVHHRLLPDNLLFDERGTVYFFVVVLRGSMYNARFDEETQEMTAEETDYAVWHGKIPIPDRYWEREVADKNGHPVPFSSALYWFGRDLHVEMVRDSLVGGYLKLLESAFMSLTPKQLKLFGKSWAPENFSKVVGSYPVLRGEPKRTKRKKKAT